MENIGSSNSGIPEFERFYLNLFFKMGSAFQSDESALKSFQTSSQDILRIVHENDIGVLSQEIVIPRLMGVEESSRNWSVLMALDHLAIVNQVIMETIRALRSDSVPFQIIRLVDFKPDSDVGADAIDRFQETNQRYWSFAKSHQPLRSNLEHKHPWIGQLDGHGWHCLAAAHQKIHRRQIYKILAMIGIT